MPAIRTVICKVFHLSTPHFLVTQEFILVHFDIIVLQTITCESYVMVILGAFITQVFRAYENSELKKLNYIHVCLKISSF